MTSLPSRTREQASSARTHAQTLAAAGRDDQALSQVVGLYHDRVYRFGLRVCRDGFDADDAVQEAFAKLARRRDVVADRSALSWLFSVVRHACLRMLRPFLSERRALGERTDEEPRSKELEPEAALARWELVQAVHAAIAQLAPPYREVIVLRDLEGLTGEETCALLGLEPATMKTRLHRARTMLRASLQAQRAQENP